MNKERLQYCIDIMKEAKNLNMIGWQSNPDYMYEVASSIEELHSCGNTACFAGYIGISPEFQKIGKIDSYGSPYILSREYLISIGNDAIIEFLEIQELDKANIITDLVLNTNSTGKNVPDDWHNPLEYFVKELYAKWKPDHVIKILEGLRDNDKELYDLYDIK